MNVRSMILAAGLLVVTGATTMRAEVPGPHPAYLHALSDLRAARHYLNDGWAWGPVRHDDNEAIREIDAGNVHINWTPLWRADLMPYGGLKASGIGKEGPARRWPR